jgi:hypothetical protein
MPFGRRAGIHAQRALRRAQGALLVPALVLLTLLGAILPAHLRQVARAQSWQPERRPVSPARDAAAPGLPSVGPADVPANTSVVPRSSKEPKPTVPAGGGSGQVKLTALLIEDGQPIEQGLIWRVYRDKPGADGKPVLVETRREMAPTLRLAAGVYLINVAFGRANLTRRISVAPEQNAQERFVLNAGGLRITPVLAGREPVNEKAVSYDIYSDERDQYGQRVRVMSGIKPGVVVRLNSGLYNIVGSYGDANAIARADVTVEAGKLTEATLTHAAGTATFKLVARAGGEAFADTQWSLVNAQGETVKESVGALPTHILAPGTYTVSAKNAGEVFQRTFTLRAGDSLEVEIVRQ